jgi:hypothetical protein
MVAASDPRDLQIALQVSALLARISSREFSNTLYIIISAADPMASWRNGSALVFGCMYASEDRQRLSVRVRQESLSFGTVWLFQFLQSDIPVSRYFTFRK